MAVIYFYCPECKDELEADDAIRGQKMNCPACWKEIAVPMLGVRVPAERERKTTKKGLERVTVPVSGGESLGLSKALVVTVIVASLALTAVFVGGFAYYRSLPRGAAGPRCEHCKGTGKVTCASCKGAKEERCTNNECKQGVIVNFRGESET